MYSICKLYITGDKFPKLIIKGVPEICKELDEMSEQITRNLKLNNKRFVYRGEPLSQWTENLRLLICKLEREPRTLEERQKILTKYNHCCARCEEKLDNVKYDLDHITPLCENGEDVLDNLQPLCLPCHAEKCANERRSIYGKTMYSELNIDVLESLMGSPKPMQLYFGDKTTNALS